MTKATKSTRRGKKARGKHNGAEEPDTTIPNMAKYEITNLTKGTDDS